MIQYAHLTITYPFYALARNKGPWTGWEWLEKYSFENPFTHKIVCQDTFPNPIHYCVEKISCKYYLHAICYNSYIKQP